MEVLVNNYPIFEDNQVLTSGQLNQLHKYLDQQNRLTRSCLIGMGIACGLEIDVVTGSEPTITINEGIGITSEGYLMKFCPAGGSCTTVQFRNYSLPQGVVYTPFQNDEFQQNVDLYELLTNDAEVDDDDEVRPLADVPQGLENKVVILFLECLDNDLKSCLGKSCDELGVDRIFNLRKLLIDADVLQEINKEFNGGRQDDLFTDKFGLESILLPRVFFDKAHTVHYFPFAFKYAEAINKIYETFKKHLSGTYESYTPILQGVYGENPFETAAIQNVFKQMEEYLGGGLLKSPWLGIQYVYGFFKDLILAYEEFRDCAYDLMLQCCPDTRRFPKHLMLGKVIDNQRGPCEINLFRHGFTQPPIYNNQGRLLEKTISLHKRIVLLLEKFSFDRLQNLIEISSKATPSCEKKSSLSVRSIPFYYDSKTESNFTQLENLELEWNFFKKNRQCQLFEKGQNALNLSYDNNAMLPEAKTLLTTPLHFDMDHLNFLRLEGFQGKGVQETLLGLTELKANANLDFDVRTIYFGNIHSEAEKMAGLPECIYRDLQVDYAIWRGKLLYFLGSFSRLITGSRFLQRKDTSKNVSNYTSTKDTSDLYEELNDVNKLNRSLNKNNWMKVVDEVHFKTKADNKSEWIKKEREAPTTGGPNTDRASVDDLHAEITKCLIAIRNSTPEDLRLFEMGPWLEAYKCPLILFIEYLKLRASKIPNNTNLTKVNTMIRLIAALQELVRNLFIYPYIDIRIVWNTLLSRSEAYHEQHNFFNFLNNHSGLEHKAGVEQGQTFVLLYQGGYTDLAQEKLKEVFESWLKETKSTIDIDDFFKLNKEGFGTILGDFTLPYKCCDPCSDLGVVQIPLDPLAVPICEIVPTRLINDKVSLIEYEALEERILHSMYEPERYRISLKKSEGKYGQAKLNLRPFPFDDKKEIQTFFYTVDNKKVLAASVNSQSAYLIETFVYEVERVEVSEREKAGNTKTIFIDSAEITVIIPIIPKGDAAIGIEGRVFYKDEKGNQLSITDAQVWTTVNKREISDVTDDKGMYSLTDDALVNGSYELNIVAKDFYKGKISKVIIKNGMIDQNVELISEVKLKGGIKNLIENIGLIENSKETIFIAEEYDASGRLYRKIIADAISKEKENVKTLIATEKVISKFNDDAVISTEVLNKTYKENRDKLLKELETTTNKTTKANRVDALKVLTNSYMDRLIINEGKKLGTESIKILKESSIQIKKAGINMGTEMKEWSKSKTRVLGKTIVGAVTKNFKT